MLPTMKHDVMKLISNLPSKKSSGHDNIDNILLKEIKSEISDVLSDIFNQSINEGIFPNIMKIEELVPLFKSKDKQLPENYRPISLLLTKIQDTNQLYNLQYGFRLNHSCKNAISEIIGNILKSRELGKYTACYYH